MEETPGVPHGRPWRSPFLLAAFIPATLYAVALALRWSLAGSTPYGDEVHHYFVARGFGAMPDNYVGHPPSIAWLWWWRPLFALLLGPGSQFGFDGFRLGYILVSAALAPVMFLWVRSLGGGKVAAAVAGLIGAAHPFLLVWGVRAFPDEMMAVILVAGMVAWQRGRPGLGALLMLAAEWTKEVALVAVLGLLALELYEATTWNRDTRRPRIAFRYRYALLVGVLALAWVPHWIAQAMDGRFPGWSRGGDLGFVLDGAFTTLWYLPFVVAGLFVQKARRPAFLALTMGGFFAVYNLRGGAAELWYFVLPSVFAAVAIVLVCERAFAAARRVPGHVAGLIPAAVALAILLAQVLVPGTLAAKDDVLHPFFSTREASLAETLQADLGNEQDLWTLADRMTAYDWNATLLVDAPWFYVYYPFSDRSVWTGTGYTEQNPLGAADWAFVIETLATGTVIMVFETPMNHALRDTYADCRAEATPGYELYRGQLCPGRTEALKANLAKWQAAMGQDVVPATPPVLAPADYGSGNATAPAA